MRKLLLIASAFLFLSFSPANYILRYKKKINKELKKIFKEENLTVSALRLDEQFTSVPNNSFYEVVLKEKTIGYININRVNACRSGGCDRPGILNTERYDHFYYMVVFDKELSILKLTVLDYQSDHGYEICSKSWLKQFTGPADQNFEYNKNIDAISGATVSVNALILEMNYLILMLKDHFNEND